MIGLKIIAGLVSLAFAVAIVGLLLGIKLDDEP